MKFRWVGDNVYGQTGYANNVRELLYAMSQLGCDAKAICPRPAEGAYIPPKCKGIVMEPGKADIDAETHLSGRTYVYNEALRPFAGVVKSLGAIMVLEGDRLPQDWVAVANSMDFLWTASEYGRRQFIANGVVPELVRVIPHGADPEVFHPDPHVHRPPELEGRFVFLFVGGFAIPGDRKGADLLACAFAQEFRPEEKACLILKINPTYGWTGPKETPTAEAYIRAITGSHPRIAIACAEATQAQLARLYNISDIHAMPSMGEAFSMNLAESMACGRTAITTNWSGPLDFCRPEFSYLVDVERFVPAHYGGWDIQAGTKWALPSSAHLRQQMRYAFDNQDEVRKKGRQAQRFIYDNYLWKHAAEKTIKALKELG